MKRSHYCLLVACLLLVSIFFRAFYLTADPPAPVPADGSFYTDQGWHNQSVLNKIQNGSWFMDLERNEITHMAFFSFMQYASLKVWGIHLWSAKLPGLLFSLSLIFISFFFYTHYAGKTVGLWLLGALAINYLHIMYSRMALAESMVNFFIMGAFVFWWISGLRSSYWALGSGLCTFMAIISKTHGIFFLFYIVLAGALGFWVISSPMERKKLISRISVLLLTLLVSGLIWYQVWLAPNLKYWISYSSHIQRAPLQSALSWTRYLNDYIIGFMDAVFNLAIRMPVVTALTVIGIYACLMKLIDNDRGFFKENRLFTASVLLFCANFIFFIAARYVRPRFQMLVIVPFLFIGLSVLLNGALRIRIRTIREKTVYVILILPVVFCPVYKIFSVKVVAPLAMKVTAAVVMVLVFSAVFFYDRILKIKSLVLGISGLYLVMQISPLMVWAKSPTFTTVEIGREIHRILESANDQDEYVLGPLAPLFALEGDFKTITGLRSSRYPDDTERFAEIIHRYHPKYILHNKRNISGLRKGYFMKYPDWHLVGTFTYQASSSYTAPPPEERELLLYRVDY